MLLEIGSAGHQTEVLEGCLTWGMSLSFCQASGIIIIMASGRSRPQCISSSSTVSYDPESDWDCGTMGSNCKCTSKEHQSPILSIKQVTAVIRKMLDVVCVHEVKPWSACALQPWFGVSSYMPACGNMLDMV